MIASPHFCSLRNLLIQIKFRNENELLEKAGDPEKYYIEVIMQEKIRLYLEYVNQHNLFYDLKIIFQTFWAIIAK